MKGQAFQQALDLACRIVNEGERPTPSAWPANATARLLARRAGAGRIDSDRVVFSNQDKLIVAQWLETHGVKPEVGVLTDINASRIDTARHQSNEKGSSASIGRSRALVALAPVGSGTVLLNDTPLIGRPCAFSVIQASDRDRLGADWMMTVENFEAFLALLEFPPQCLPSGGGVLIMRSSYSFPHGQTWARERASAQGITHFHAPDLDPHGLSHVIEMAADYAFLPSIATLSSTEFVRRPELFWKHDRLHDRLAGRALTHSPGISPWVDWMMSEQTAVTQESMLAAALPFVAVRASHR